MRIGIPTEIKTNERRVALTPSGACTLSARGHEVLVEAGAGARSGFGDDAYRAAGAHLVGSAADVWRRADLVVKVKEPIASEFGNLRDDLVLFTYLHLAASEPLRAALQAANTTAIAYETVQLPDGSLPLLAPMSEIAGRLSVTEGAHALLRPEARGTLLGGVAGTPPPKVVVLGGGVAGEHAIANAIGLGAKVTVLDISIPRLRDLQRRFGPALETRPSTSDDVAEQLSDADLVVGAVLIPGAAAPKLVTRSMVDAMPTGAVLVDIAIDQGGCFEGSRPTTHDDPVFTIDDAVYYCVANIPGAVPATSTRALTNATLPYVVGIADQGWECAMERDPALRAGLATGTDAGVPQTTR
jgi:alanine dehydrogenase